MLIFIYKWVSISSHWHWVCQNNDLKSPSLPRFTASNYAWGVTSWAELRQTCLRLIMSWKFKNWSNCQSVDPVSTCGSSLTAFINSKRSGRVVGMSRRVSWRVFRKFEILCDLSIMMSPTETPEFCRLWRMLLRACMSWLSKTTRPDYLRVCPLILLRRSEIKLWTTESSWKESCWRADDR